MGIQYIEHFYGLASQNTAMLEKNAADFPCCSLAGFLLLYHYKKTGHPHFEKYAQQMVLHFKNPLWFQLLLDTTSKQSGGNHRIHAGNYEAEVKSTNENEPEEVTQALYNGAASVEEVPEVKPAEVFEMYPEIEKKQEEEVARITDDQHFPKAAETQDSGDIPAEVSFEPLHTVDYFASQGIKITEEPVTNDKLGNQLKSFTDWLKSMKKLHPSKLAEQDLATEKLIQSAAEESNVDTEIITEAMAEVLIKQDKKEKAIEMYNKLSLLYPSKSVYFAAKIESIKSS